MGENRICFYSPQLKMISFGYTEKTEFFYHSQTLENSATLLVNPNVQLFASFLGSTGFQWYHKHFIWTRNVVFINHSLWWCRATSDRVFSRFYDENFFLEILANLYVTWSLEYIGAKKSCFLSDPPDENFQFS